MTTPLKERREDFKERLEDRFGKSARGLGKTQVSVLSLLCQRGKWTPGYGWEWVNTSTTTNILNSLAKRGLVVREIGNVWGSFLPTPEVTEVWDACSAEHDAAKEARRAAEQAAQQQRMLDQDAQHYARNVLIERYRDEYDNLVAIYKGLA
jgi:hypothetical protein